MRKNRIIARIFVAVICFISMLSMYVFAFADVDVSTATGKAVEKMHSHGYIQGFGDDTFRPDDTLTRAEFVTIINKMYGFSVESENIFTDINESDWYYGAVLTAVQAGYIKGMGDGRFAPNEAVTREQVCVMLNSILNVQMLPYSQKITDEISGWARESVEKLVSNRMFSLEDGGKFRATEPITRGETCLALEKCIVDADLTTEIEPIDIKSMAKEELDRRLNHIIKCMEETIIPTYTYEETVQVGNMLVDSMKKYLEDSNYDYVSAAKDTYEVYRKFGREKANEFKDAIYENIEIEDIAILYDFFYRPEMNLPN